MEIEKSKKENEDSSSEEEIEDFMVKHCSFKFPTIQSTEYKFIVVGCLGVGSTIAKSQALKLGLKGEKITYNDGSSDCVMGEVYTGSDRVYVSICKVLGVHLIHNFGRDLMNNFKASKSSTIILDSEYIPFADISSKCNIRWIGNDSFIGNNNQILPLEQNIARNNISADIFQASISNGNQTTLLFLFQEESEFSVEDCNHFISPLSSSLPDLFHKELDFKYTMKEMKSNNMKNLYI